MRSILFSGLMMAVIGLSTSALPAQAPKGDAKDEGPKTPEYKWPEKIQNKNLDTWIKEMRGSKDASTRDEAIHTIPYFGPKACRGVFGQHLIDVINLDPDINVRLAAIGAVPTLVLYDDPIKDKAFDVLIAILKNPNQANHTKHEAAEALGRCGPFASKAIPTLIAITLVDPNSWQNRKAAAAALGRVGLPKIRPDGKIEEGGPNIYAVKAMAKLLYLETKDKSHLVRREAINSLLQLGPPEDVEALDLVRKALEETFNHESNRSVKLWARVAHIRTDTKLIKSNDERLLYIAKIIPTQDVIINEQKKIEKEIKDSGKLESKKPLEKQDALDKMQTAIQIRTEALAAKQEAVQALGYIGEEAVSRLPDLLAIVESKDEEPVMIANALWALSQMASETDRILQVVDGLRRAENKVVKDAAEAAYTYLTDKKKADTEKKKDVPPKKK